MAGIISGPAEAFAGAIENAIAEAAADLAAKMCRQRALQAALENRHIAQNAVHAADEVLQEKAQVVSALERLNNGTERTSTALATAVEEQFDAEVARAKAWQNLQEANDAVRNLN
jgi:hypothetical protein